MSATATLTREEKLDLVKKIEERARRRLIHFTKYTKPEYKIGWFNRLLARELDRFLDDVIAGKCPRLIIEAPPRHGKSEIASRRFPALALGKYPDLSIIATSYSSDLASAMNRDVQKIIDSPLYHQLFPETTLSGSNVREVTGAGYLRNSEEFEVVNKLGRYKSAGVGAGITGRGGHILIVDDPIKDSADAHSETVRKSCWDWFTSTLYSRQEPGAGMLVIMTRWHMDDLAGRLKENMKKGGEQWRIVRFPAIAEDDEFDEDGTLLRQKGEALHRARYDEAALERIKVGTADEVGVGSRVWASLYQQRPSAAEGDIFLRDNWRFLRPPQALESMSHQERAAYLRSLGVTFVVQGWDTALGGKKRNDYTACTTLAVAPNRYFVLNVWRGKIQFPDVLKQVEMLHDAWRPNMVAVEGGGSASGKAIVQLMSRGTRIPFKEVSTTTDKIFRADALSPIHEGGLITIIEDSTWQATFVDQCANFPNIKNDDDVDSFMIALEAGSTRGIGSRISKELLSKLKNGRQR